MSEARKDPDPIQLPLREEIAAFNGKRAEWVASGLTGKWVAMKADAILSFFPDMSAAYAAGLRAFGNVPFLVKEIREKDERIITHRMAPRRRGA
jgi:hypothetical protein